MPKLKTHKGARKRFKVTAKGKIMRRHAYRSHLLAKKSSKRKRRLEEETIINSCDKSKIRQMLPYQL